MSRDEHAELIHPIDAAGDLAPELAAAVETGRALVAGDIASRTADVYGRAFVHFEVWANSQGLSACPASPPAVVAYVGELVNRDRAPSSIGVVVAAIRREHANHGEPDPTSDELVRRALKGVRRRAAGRRPRQARALTWRELDAILVALPDTLAGVRDGAVLTLGLATGRRRSELVALEARDLRWVAGELTVHVRKSKTDQTGRGQFVGIALRPAKGCPVRAVMRWLGRAGINQVDDGPLFRPVDRWDRVRDRALSPADIGRIVQRGALRAELAARGELSAHSLRRGCVTELYRAGVPLDRIARHVGHKTIETTRSYVDELVALDGSNPLRELWTWVDGSDASKL